MTSEETTQGQHAIECDLCKQPVLFFCRRCGVNLCDPCVTVHLRVKSKTGHDVVNYASREDDDSCMCDSHPQNECSAYCQTCDAPICLVCVSIKHKSHEMSELSEKIEDLMKTITKENERLQKYRGELEKILDYTTQRLPSLSNIYKLKKGEVTTRGEEWHRQIDKTVKEIHQELDDMQKQHESLLQKQKRELEEILGKVDEMNTTTTKLKTSQNVMEMKKCIPKMKHQEIPSDISQYSFPVFCKCEIDNNYMKSYFGYIENIQEMKISLPRLIPEDAVISNRKMIEVPKVITTIDSEFPANEQYNDRLYDIAVIDDNRVVMGGASRELKLFDLQGKLHDTVPITADGMLLSPYMSACTICPPALNVRPILDQTVLICPPALNVRPILDQTCPYMSACTKCPPTFFPKCPYMSALQLYPAHRSSRQQIKVTSKCLSCLSEVCIDIWHV